MGGIHRLCGVLFLWGLAGCASAPRLDPLEIRGWNTLLEKEYPGEKSVIAHYHRNGFELFYLASRHSNDPKSDTLALVRALFDRFHFDALIIEPLPYGQGESPTWFADQARVKSTKTVANGEGGLGAMLAQDHHIPFFGGEPEHLDIYKDLKQNGYTDEDIIAFYVIRQIPQWVREGQAYKGLLEKNVPPFAKHYCKEFSISHCPNVQDIKQWYQVKLGEKLKTNVSNEVTAPLADGSLFTQKISSQIAKTRDRFTLQLIENRLARHKRVAVIYGSGHFITLSHSFRKAMGEPAFVER